MIPRSTHASAGRMRRFAVPTPSGRPPPLAFRPRMNGPAKPVTFRAAGRIARTLGPQPRETRDGFGDRVPMNRGEGLPDRIRLSGVSKSFGRERVLDSIDLAVPEGENLVVIGPSASGKTILLKTIIGLFRPEAGSIAISGRDSVGLDGPAREALARTGMLFQRAALFDSMRVWENVTFLLRRTERLSRDDAIDAAVSRLADVGLGAEVALLYPAELSGGMQKRVGIARALANAPDILLLDEPTAGLDPVTATVITDLISDNVGKLGATAITVTSNMASARALADRVAMLHEGRVVWTGDAAGLDDSDNAYVRQFVDQNPDGPIVMEAA